MSIQDDIFDIQEALNKKPGLAKAFDNLCSYLGELEEAVETQQRTLTDIRKGAKAIKRLFNE